MVSCPQYSWDRLWIKLDPDQDEALTEDELNGLKIEAVRLPTEVKDDDPAVFATTQDRKILILISAVDLLQQRGSNVILKVLILTLLLFQ